MMQNLLWLLPDEAFPLLAVLLVVAAIAGFVRARLAVAFLAFVLLLPVIGEMLGRLLDALPWWLVLLLIAGFVMAIMRAALGVLIGSRATDHAVGILAAGAIRRMFRMAFVPFRVVAWLVRR